MALLQNGNYVKISKISVDYIDNRSTVTVRRYSSEFVRQRERLFLQKAREFLYAAHCSMTSLSQQVEQEKAKAGTTDMSSVSDKLRSLLRSFSVLQQDYRFLTSSIGHTQFSMDSLRRPDFWSSLGFDELLCVPILTETAEISIQTPEQTNLSSVYPVLKQYMPGAQDC